MAGREEPGMRCAACAYCCAAVRVEKRCGTRSGENCLTKGVHLTMVIIWVSV